MEIYFTIFKKTAFVFGISILILFTLVNCSPDKADVINVVVKKINIEDTLNNKMIMDIDGKNWESNSSAKVYYANGGIEFDAAKWVDSTKAIETLKFYINNNKKTGKYFLQNKNPDENYAVFQIYPFSSPIPADKYNSESGFVNIISQTDTNLVGTFEVTLVNLDGLRKLIKNGKFNLKFID